MNKSKNIYILEASPMSSTPESDQVSIINIKYNIHVNQK